MTQLDVCFRYGVPPGGEVMTAINRAQEVYGIRRIWFDEKEKTVCVEFDATRFKAEVVASLLRGAGLDLREKITLV